MIVNWIWWWDSCSGGLGNVEYHSLPLLLDSLWPGLVVFMNQIDICKLFVLERNTWYHITMKNTFKKQLYKICKYKCTIYAIPQPLGIK